MNLISDSILTPQRPIPDVRLGYTPTRHLSLVHKISDLTVRAEGLTDRIDGGVWFQRRLYAPSILGLSATSKFFLAAHGQKSVRVTMPSLSASVPMQT